MSGVDAGGKGNGDGGGSGKAKKGGGFWAGVKQFGADFAESFARNMSAQVTTSTVQRSTAGKPIVSRQDPVTTHELPRAARQIHRTLKAQAQRAVDEKAAADEKDRAAPNADEATAADGAAMDDEQQQGADGAAADEAAGANAAEATEASGGGDDKKPEEGAKAGGEEKGEEKQGDGAGADDGAEAKSEEKPPLSVAAKLRGVHRKVFRAANAPGSAAAPAAAKEPFKPKSSAAGGDTVESFDNSGKPGLKVAGKPGGAALDIAAQQGPLANAKNKAGLELVRSAANTVQDAQKSLASLSLADGKIAQADQTTVDGAVDKAAAAVSGVLKTMKIESLARTMDVGDGLPAESVAFKSQDSENDIEREQFKKELERQVQMQAEGLNKLTVDDWAFNVNTFKLDQEKFEKLHESARLAVLNRLKEDAETAVARARTKKAEKEAALKELQAAIAATKKGEKKTPDIKDAKKLGIGGREGDEDKARETLKKQGAFETLKKEVTEWSTLVEKLSDMAVLHNPDQIAGGGDKGLAPIPKPPADDTKAEMDRYIAELKKLVGAQRVNGSLGSQWEGKIKGVYKNVTTAIDQTAWPLFRLNLNLSVE